MIYSVAFVCYVAFLVGIVGSRHIQEWHHAYVGVLLVLTAMPSLRWVGVVIIADDAGQHLLQVWYPAFLSPLHRAYAWVRARGWL